MRRLRLAFALVCLFGCTCSQAQDAQAGGGSLAPSKCLPGCTRYGTCNEEIGRCDCPKDRDGDDCTETLERSRLQKRCSKTLYPSVKECITSELSCLNMCNKRGECVSGWCHCNPGYYGADCSLSTGSDGKPALLAGSGYTTREKRPWVYIYELPPVLLSWTNTKRLDRSTHLHFYQRLLGSGARVADGDLADWYYIPVRLRRTHDSAYLDEALTYVQQTYPWWNRTGGLRHFVIHTGDLGADEVLSAVRQRTTNLTFLTHWGLTTDKVFSGWRKAHRPETDVVVPVFMTPGHFRHFGLERTPLHPLMEKLPRNVTFFFAGRICGDRKPPQDGRWPNCGPASRGYSAGVRQYVHYHHWNRTGFRVVTYDKAYGRSLATSRFCLAPLGGGHGQRQIVVSFLGCVPVCIADNVYEPFEPQTDWSEFAVRPSEADIPRLHEILDAITPDQLAAKQVALRCAAQHFVYSSIVGGLFGEDGRYDAFETTLEVLRVKAEHPEAPPETYRKIDADFDAFMACRDPPRWKVVGPVPDTWGLQGGSGSSSDDSGEGKDARKGKGAQKGEEEEGADGSGGGYGNPLCSHSLMDMDRGLPCQRFVLGSSKTHGIPGGMVCRRTQHDLGKCPRIWL